MHGIGLHSVGTGIGAMERRQVLRMMGVGGLGMASATVLAACTPTQKTQAVAGQDGGVINSNDSYVYLSIGTQVPFWVDQKQALDDFAKLTGAKARFTGPADFNVQAQVEQLDSLISQKPAGIVIFLGDADAMTPGINRAADAGIPVVLCISDAPKSKRLSIMGIDNFSAGQAGAKLLADAIGGKGKVALGTFESPGVLDRAKGYQAWFKDNAPGIEVVATVNDKADPSYAPQAYAAALAAHPDIVGIGGTDGDSGLGAAQAVKEAGMIGKVKIVCQDRNDDMLQQIKAGTITASVVQKSYTETWYALMSLYWLNHSELNPIPGGRKAGLNFVPESVVTGTWACNKDNVDLFMHKR